MTATPKLVADVVRALERMRPVADDASIVHAASIRALRAAGFSVDAEVYVALGEGRGGRFDLVVEKNGARVAIELDARRPRRRSVEKLKSFDGGRVIGLRGVAGVQYLDIDAVAVIPVREAYASEKGRKALVGQVLRGTA